MNDDEGRFFRDETPSSGDPARSEVSWRELGNGFLAAGMAEQAEDALRQAIEAEGSSPDPSLIREYADAIHASGRLNEAIAVYMRALDRDENLAAAWWGLGTAFAAGNEQAAAMECFERLVALNPQSIEAHHNLGKCLFSLGEVDRALDSFRRAVAIQPHPLPLGMIAIVIPGSHRADHRAILDARRAWAEACLPPPPPAPPLAPRDGPIRVGYVSSFFQSRNWMKPVWALINHHDRERFHLTLFSDAPREKIVHGYRADPRDAYVAIQGQSNDDAARLVRESQIDILVDLNAFSKFERLPLFALRPAPIQVEWFALFATSGMNVFDALVGDPHTVRQSEEPFYTEPIVRADGCYMTFEVDYPVPDVTPPPCLKRGALTFGCLAPLYKITPQVDEVFAAILSGAPRSRLILQASSFGSEGTRAYLLDRLAQVGIDISRVELRGPAEHFHFLETYQDIDIGIDTFPYNGGTTTTEALWQGVPTLTFDGDRWVSRVSATLLRHAGLDEWVAPDQVSYVAEAIRLANDPETPSRLATLRASMRERLLSSPVCDAPRFTRSMEGIYESLLERKRRD